MYPFQVEDECIWKLIYKPLITTTSLLFYKSPLGIQNWEINIWNIKVCPGSVFAYRAILAKKYT